MGNKKYSLFFLIIPTIFISYLVNGCAVYQTLGIDKEKAVSNSNLNGKSEIYGTLRMMDYKNWYLNGKKDTHLFTNPITTTIKLDPKEIQVTTDPSGNFTFQDLEPGDYSIVFTDNFNRTKRVNVKLNLDQKLDLIVYVQDKLEMKFDRAEPQSTGSSKYTDNSGRGRK